MNIKLVCEGTYPFNFGGVSVWCDQLLRNMPEHEFTVLALMGDGRERAVWERLPNVTVLRIPLWAASPPHRRIGGARRGRMLAVLDVLLESIVDPDDALPEADDAQQAAFGWALRNLVSQASGSEITSLLRSEEAVLAAARIWTGRTRAGDTVLGSPSLGDALAALDLLEHAFRPLTGPAGKSSVTHAVAGGLSALPGLVDKWQSGTPFLMTEHGIYLRERYLGMDSSHSWPVRVLLLGFLRRLSVECYREADLIAPGNLYNRRWQLLLGAEDERIQTIYNGVEPGEFPLAGPEPEVPTISWIGRIDPIKDLETLINAFALTRAKVPEARLRIFGGAPTGGERYLNKCRELVQHLGIEDATVFEGRVEEVRTAYEAGSLVALSSISEGFPYSLIEAMASGRATVATNVGGVGEAVGEAGLLVPPRDPEAMAAAFETLLRDPARRAELGQAARARVLEFFTVGQAVDAYRSAYETLGPRKASLTDRLRPTVDERSTVLFPREQAVALAR
jgi:polysaccharide biosynthesis protein PelF